MQFQWCHDLDRNTESVFKFYLQPSEIEKGCSGHSIDKQVEIARLCVITVQNRPEHARICDAMSAHNFQNQRPILLQYVRRLHDNKSLE